VIDLVALAVGLPGIRTVTRSDAPTRRARRRARTAERDSFRRSDA
jgi:hypothetical protein